jgi:hypothetical protein
MTIPDPLADIRAFLLTVSTVTDLVGDRVFVAEIPEGKAAGMPTGTVVISPVGGLGRPKRLKIRHLRIDTICHGATLHESKSVHDAVREALETLTTPTGSVKTVEIASEAQNARDPDKQWPTCYASYLALTTTAA